MVDILVDIRTTRLLAATRLQRVLLCMATVALRLKATRLHRRDTLEALLHRKGLAATTRPLLTAATRRQVQAAIIIRHRMEARLRLGIRHLKEAIIRQQLEPRLRLGIRRRKEAIIRRQLEARLRLGIRCRKEVTIRRQLDILGMFHRSMASICKASTVNQHMGKLMTRATLHIMDTGRMGRRRRGRPSRLRQGLTRARLAVQRRQQLKQEETALREAAIATILPTKTPTRMELVGMLVPPRL